MNNTPTHTQSDIQHNSNPHFVTAKVCIWHGPHCSMWNQSENSLARCHQSHCSL